MKTVNCDIFDYPAKAIIHQCNCFHTMGGGIALEIKKRFPAAYAVDLETPYGDKEKLGTFSCVKEHGKTIFNMYSQYGFGHHQNHTNYAAMSDALCGIFQYCRENNIKTVSIPYGIGCGLAGGDWVKVLDVIKTSCKDFSGVVICKLDNSK